MSRLMRSEIAEQPDVLLRTLRDLAQSKAALAQLSNKSFSRILFIARGTSDNVAAYGLFLAPMLSGLEAYSLSPSLLNSYQLEPDLSGALVIAISQSGETQEIVEAAGSARALGATVIAITNNGVSSLERIASVCLVTPAGKELAVPATKTYTSALMALAWCLGTLFENNELLLQLERLPEILEQQLADTRISSEIVATLAESRTCVMAGRGLTMGASFEAALKLKETSGINAIGTSVADLVHGPIAALSSEVPLLVISGGSDSPVYAGLLDLIKRAKALGAKVVTLGDFKPGDQSLMHISTPIFAGAEWVAPLWLAIPSQLLAAGVADYRGVDADNPAGLKKVTQTV